MLYASQTGTAQEIARNIQARLVSSFRCNSPAGVLQGAHVLELGCKACRQDTRLPDCELSSGQFQ